VNIVSIEHLDGVPWWEAPPPPREHEHWAQTTGTLQVFEQVERCPCGAIRSNIRPNWVLLDPPRVAVDEAPSRSERGSGLLRRWLRRTRPEDGE
jgi:hypothetical protein